MANGREAAKQVAHLTTAMSNDDDGVIVQASLTRVSHTSLTHTSLTLCILHLTLTLVS